MPFVGLTITITTSVPQQAQTTHHTGELWVGEDGRRDSHMVGLGGLVQHNRACQRRALHQRNWRQLQGQNKVRVVTTRKIACTCTHGSSRVAERPLDISICPDRCQVGLRKGAAVVYGHVQLTCMRLVTSPTAQIDGTLVREYSSTSTVPFCPILMPTESRPKPSTLGVRPTKGGEHCQELLIIVTLRFATEVVNTAGITLGHSSCERATGCFTTARGTQLKCMRPASSRFRNLSRKREETKLCNVPGGLVPNAATACTALQTHLAPPHAATDCTALQTHLAPPSPTQDPAEAKRSRDAHAQSFTHTHIMLQLSTLYQLLVMIGT